MFSGTHPDERTAYWNACKDESYSLHERINSQLKSGVPPTPETMQEWKNTLRELNKNVTRYSRAVAASESRLRLEAELLKQSVTHDILDREATFTSTLEAIRSVESKAGESSSSSSEFLDGSVARAMQAVSSINSAMGSITAAKEPFYADAAECAALTSG